MKRKGALRGEVTSGFEEGPPRGPPNRGRHGGHGHGADHFMSGTRLELPLYKKLILCALFL